MTLLQKLERGVPLRVLFLNDLGFQFGAGIATLRQVQSFLLRGDCAMGVCAAAPSNEDRFEFDQSSGEWLGFQALPELGRKRVCSDAQAAQRLAFAAASAYPDVIIAGNIHNARWPVSFLHDLRAAAPVIAYMHDCHFATGRCAYAGTCKLYQIGCNETCPTAHQYPALAPELIHDAWLERRRVFGKGGIPLVANSHWTRRFALEAIPDARAEVIHYGVDTEIFRPGDKADARRRLGIPDDRVVILGGAVNLQDIRKGGVHLQTIFERLGKEVHGIVLGANSEGIAGAQPLGLVSSQRKVRLIYRAADIFVNTSLDEAFGQMMLEAAACGLPIVAFDAGGVRDISRQDVNALLVPRGDVEQLVQAAQFFVRDAVARERFGAEGRRIAVNEFSLARQAETWTHYLFELAKP
jgi:glycosyltransferase involved in cell wall biosynthesis